MSLPVIESYNYFKFMSFTGKMKRFLTFFSMMKIYLEIIMQTTKNIHLNFSLLRCIFPHSNKTFFDLTSIYNKQINKYE